MTSQQIIADRPLLHRLFDAVVLWVPFERRPRFLAFLIVLVRQVTLPFVILVPLALAVGPLAQRQPMVATAVGLACFVVFEELGRYSFARRAERPGRAIMLFTFLIIATETCLYYRPEWTPMHNLTTRAPSWLVHSLAGAGLFIGLSRPKALPGMLAAIIVIHTAFNVASAAYAPSASPAPSPSLLNAPKTVSSTPARMS